MTLEVPFLENKINSLIDIQIPTTSNPKKIGFNSAYQCVVGIEIFINTLFGLLNMSSAVYGIEGNLLADSLKHIVVW